VPVSCVPCVCADPQAALLRLPASLPPTARRASAWCS
jgi:hypothetical protein